MFWTDSWSATRSPLVRDRAAPVATFGSGTWGWSGPGHEVDHL